MSIILTKHKTISGDFELKGIGKSTSLVLKEAERQGIIWENLPYTTLFKLQYLESTKFFHGEVPSETTEYASHCCNNKQITKNILEEAGVSINKGHLLKHSYTPKTRALLFNSLQKPLVVKPANSQCGNNVHVNISTKYLYQKAIDEIYKNHKKRKVDILVEEMFIGNEYRILATQDKILSVIKRIAANVVGDGHSTILELIQLKNSNPVRITIPTYHNIDIDSHLIKFLKKQTYSVKSILPEGKRVFLRPKGPLDISQGGDTIDVTDDIDPSVHEIVSTIMQSIPGLALAGIDFITKNIHTEQLKNTYRIIEINSSPSIDWNEFPLEGPQRRIAFEFLKIMFPSLN